MAKEEPKSETASTAGTTSSAAQRRLRMDTSNMKTAYCNFFVAQDNPNEVVLNFGFNQSLGANQRDVQVQMLQQVVLHPATARRVRDTLVSLFQKRDSRRAGAITPSGTPKKPN